MGMMQKIEEYEKIPRQERDRVVLERIKQGKPASPFITDEEIERYKELKQKLKQKNEVENGRAKL